jgi:hypothetical protein
MRYSRLTDFRNGLFGLALCLCMVLPSAAQTLNADKLNGKSLEAAASYAQSLEERCFIIIGGSVLLIVGTSHRRPSKKAIRSCYLLFLPAWGCLAGSVYFGTRAQQAYLAYHLLPAATVEGAIKSLNNDIRTEITWMFLGLAILLIWLVVYLCWWIFTKQVAEGQGDS